MAATKRKRSSAEAAKINGEAAPSLKRRTSTRKSSTAAVMNPDINSDIIDGPSATRASPDGEVHSKIVPSQVKQESRSSIGSPLSDAPDVVHPPKKKGRGRKSDAAKQVKEAGNATKTAAETRVANGTIEKKGKGRPKAVKENGDANAAESSIVPPASKAKKNTMDEPVDPEVEGDEEADEEEVKEALSRPPPVNSDYLPLPWKGRLGYACLNTYLRNSNPPVFSSRTCRIQSILEHRHPLQDPSQPEHATKNRPDRSKPVDIELGKRYVEALCLANVRDIIKMVRWNERYNIKFFRLSSEMFPFASHPEYGYKLAPFASEALAEAGKVIAELGHRVTTHPGQFTQLGSPRKSVIDNAIRDLEYHDELLTLLKLPEQLDKDAVMILHMGGIFEGKQETLQRFRENYVNLSQSVKNRLVLENDDMGWSVHDLLPICEELNIPFVLDFHHHNIVFDSSQIREGTKDIIDLFPRIKATWERKGITQKMHYSEPTPPAITPRQRRKHSPRVATLPPCATDMDLMIEAKDKEQAVFELMRTFKLPGFERFNDVIPHVRSDDNKIALAAMAKKARKTKKSAEEDEPDSELIPVDEVGMGGLEGRVYWPPGMEDWLRPKKRELKKKDPVEKAAKSIKKEAAEAVSMDAEDSAVVDEESDPEATPATKKARAAMRKKEQVNRAKAAATVNGQQSGKRARPKKETRAPTPPSSDESDALNLDDDDHERPTTPVAKRPSVVKRKASGRKTKKSVNYNEDEDAEMDEA